MRLDQGMRDIATAPEPEVKAFTPSPQQSAIFDWILTGQGSANVIAVAGAGKTTTLEKSCALLEGQAVFTAFNKKIADEIAWRIKRAGAGNNVQAKTFHALGHAALRQVVGRFDVNSRKMDEIADKMKIPDKLRGSAIKLVSLYKNHAAEIAFPLTPVWAAALMDHFDMLTDLPENMDEDDAMFALYELSTAMLKESRLYTKTIGMIDFDDMIYEPLALEAPFPRADWVLVDEAQDTNPSRRMVAERMLKPGGRAIFVGDPRQAIYGFTGADANAMTLIAQKFGCIDLPLTITYRCPKAVVRHAQRWVSHIEAAPTAPEGRVLEIDEFEFRGTSDRNEIQKQHWMNQQVLNKDSVILCRYTKPLVSLAFECIRANIPCHVEGKEIGRGLIALCKKWKSVRTVEELETRLHEYLISETRKFREKKQDAKAEALADRIETIFVIMDALDEPRSISSLVFKIESLFGDTPDGGKSRDLTLSTVHKAKGREWPTVFLWGRNKFMPSKYATQEWQIEQEENLIYVAVTRAQERLVEVSVRG